MADLIEVFDYVASHDSQRNAERLRDAILTMCASLDKMPTRGHYPPEFLKVGTKVYREIHYKPYRIFYQTIERDVFVVGILHGSRKLDVILRERMRRFLQS
jgi:toxin ParE1/3/4